MRDVFSLGVRSTQLNESFNNALKNHLKSDYDIVRFFKHFEKTVKEKRRNWNLNLRQGKRYQED
jgi:zinc finger SWIM domain-containing protein 3